MRWRGQLAAGAWCAKSTGRAARPVRPAPGRRSRTPPAVRAGAACHRRGGGAARATLAEGEEARRRGPIRVSGVPAASARRPSCFPARARLFGLFDDERCRVPESRAAVTGSRGRGRCGCAAGHTGEAHGHDEGHEPARRRACPTADVRRARKGDPRRRRRCQRAPPPPGPSDWPFRRLRQRRVSRRPAVGLATKRMADASRRSRRRQGCPHGSPRAARGGAAPPHLRCSGYSQRPRCFRDHS